MRSQFVHQGTGGLLLRDAVGCPPAGDQMPRHDASYRAAGKQRAQDIERADGTWQDGKWMDFDPLKPALLVDLPAPEDIQLRK